MKKKLLLLLLFCLYLSLNGEGCTTQEPISNPPTSSGGSIKLYTENNGLTWEVHNIDLTLRPTGISSFSSDLSTFSISFESTSGRGAEIKKTTDFGENFFTTIQGGSTIRDITNTGTDGKGFFIRSRSNFFSSVSVTTDDGSSWTVMDSSLTGKMYAMDFGDEMNGIIIPENPGDNTCITNNGGLNWIAGPPITSSAYINDIAFINSTTAVVCGNSGKIFRTTDIGASWTEITSPTNQDLNSIDFIDPVGIIVGNYGTILRTTNGGLNWVAGSTSATSHLRKVYLSDLAYWACGDNVILNSFNTGNSWGTVRNVSNEYYKDLFFMKNAGFVVGSKQ